MYAGYLLQEVTGERSSAAKHAKKYIEICYRHGKKKQTGRKRKKAIA